MGKWPEVLLNTLWCPSQGLTLSAVLRLRNPILQGSDPPCREANAKADVLRGPAESE